MRASAPLSRWRGSGLRAAEVRRRPSWAGHRAGPTGVSRRTLHRVFWHFTTLFRESAGSSPSEAPRGRPPLPRPPSRAETRFRGPRFGGNGRSPAPDITGIHSRVIAALDQSRRAASDAGATSLAASRPGGPVRGEVGAEATPTRRGEARLERRAVWGRRTVPAAAPCARLQRWRCKSSSPLGFPSPCRRGGAVADEAAARASAASRPVSCIGLPKRIRSPGSGALFSATSSGVPEAPCP